MKDREKLTDIVILVLGIVAFVLLWPVIKWLARLILVALIIFVIYVLVTSRVQKKRIEADPASYFNMNIREKEPVRNDAIEPQWQERVIEEEEK